MFPRFTQIRISSKKLFEAILHDQGGFNDEKNTKGPAWLDYKYKVKYSLNIEYSMNIMTMINEYSLEYSLNALNMQEIFNKYSIEYIQIQWLIFRFQNLDSEFLKNLLQASRTCSFR